MTTPQCYSATFTDDIHFGIEEVQRRFPDAPLFAAGYSLGALILTKYLAEADTGKWPKQGRILEVVALLLFNMTLARCTYYCVDCLGDNFSDYTAQTHLQERSRCVAVFEMAHKESAALLSVSCTPTAVVTSCVSKKCLIIWTPKVTVAPYQFMFVLAGSGITCAALVSSPTCLSTASNNLQRPWTLGRLYNLILAVRLKSYFKDHEHQMSQHATLDALTEAWTIAHFDKAVVCKVFGYGACPCIAGPGAVCLTALASLRFRHLFPEFSCAVLPSWKECFRDTAACLCTSVLTFLLGW